MRNRNWSIKGTDATLIVISIVGYLALTIYSRGDFLSSNSVRTFLTFLAVPILIGLAQMVALCVGQLNLAVGALGGFLACWMGALMVDNGLPMPLVLLIGLVAGTLIGAITGLIIVGTRINGFIVTLATMTILMGAQYRVVGTRTVNGYSDSLKAFGEATIGPVPVIFLVACAVAAALAWFYRRTVEGRKLPGQWRQSHCCSAVGHLQRSIRGHRPRALGTRDRSGRDHLGRLTPRRQRQRGW